MMAGKLAESTGPSHRPLPPRTTLVGGTGDEMLHVCFRASVCICNGRLNWAKQRVTNEGKGAWFQCRKLDSIIVMVF